MHMRELESGSSLDKRNIETLTAKGNHDFVVHDFLRKFVEIDAVDKSFNLLTVKESNGRDVIVRWGEPGSFDVQKNGTMTEFRENSPPLSAREMVSEKRNLFPF